MRDVKIKDVPLVESLTGQEKIPVSDGSGSPKAISVQQILDKTPAPDLSEYVKIGDLVTNYSVTKYEYVDLGLPSGTLWATCNVGANSPEEYGDYFAWGETTTKSSYSESNSTTYGLSTSTLQSRGIIGEDGNLTASYDVATTKWGGDWRMPTKEEMKELDEDCTWTWTTQNGVNGMKVTGPNGNNIFIPATGIRQGTNLGLRGSFGYYWSSTLYESGSNLAYTLYFDNGSRYWNNYGTRYVGFTVRPVMTKKPILSDYYTKEEIDEKVPAKEEIYSKEEMDALLSISKYEFVDLGLPSGLKWATCNVGAENPWDYGMYFAWGEPDGYYTTNESGSLVIKDKDGVVTNAKSSGFYWGDYQLCNGSDTSMTKYCVNSSYGTVDGKTVLEQVDDAAYVSDNTCRMPTKVELEELMTGTTSAWTTDYNGSGVSGMIFTSKVDTTKSIFIPAAGRVADGSLLDVGSDWYLWSSSLDESYPDNAWHLYANSYSINSYYYLRYYGYSVRAVQEANVNSSFDPTNYYTKEEIDSKGYLTEHQDLSAYALKSEIYTKEEIDGKLTNYQYINSTELLPVDKNLIVASISSNSAFSFEHVPDGGREIHIVVNNTSNTDVIVTIPTQNPYVNLSSDNLTVPSGGYSEINAISDGVNIYIRTL